MAIAKQKRTVTRKRPTSRKKKKPVSAWLKVGLPMLLLILCSPFYYGYVLKLLSTVWFSVSHPGEDINYPTYSHYQIKIPKQHQIHGIDVSYYQGKIDWNQVKKMNDDGVKVHFAFIKATEGLLTVDPYFSRNWREAPKAGIKVGAYHFFRPKKSGRWQAKFFLQNISIERGDLPPVVDIEQLDGVSPADMRKELNAFLVYVEEKAGVKPIIYSGLRFYRDYLAEYYRDYPFWVAHYYEPRLNLSQGVWKFWQHSDKARINGINHRVDFNAFNGDSTAFNQMLIP